MKNVQEIGRSMKLKETHQLVINDHFLGVTTNTLKNTVLATSKEISPEVNVPHVSSLESRTLS
jgi:hypothetical protein